jgi:hypothetical protein
MTNINVRFRAGPLLEQFIAALAQNSHTTAKEIHEMFSICAFCQHTATVAAVGLDRGAWFGKSRSEKLEFVLYGLCAHCCALPDVKERTEAFLFSSAWVC